MSYSENRTIDEQTITGTRFEYRARVVQDTEPAIDPRKDYSNAGRIVALDADWRTERPQEDGPDRYSRANAASILDAIQDHSFPVVSRWLRVFHGATVVLPLYGLLNGLQAGDPDAQDPADGYSGVTFDTPDSRVEICGDLIDPSARYSSKDLAQITRALVADVDTYTAWAAGNVYGWIVERRPVDSDDEWEDLDSVWGYIGETEYPMSEAVSTAESYRTEDDQAATDDAAEIESLRLSELGLPA